MKYVTSEAVSSEGSVAKAGNIDWNDFNYPILIKLYHYKPEQTPEVHRRRVSLLRINHTLVIIATFLNIIANIAGTAQGVPQGGIRLAISFFLFFLWLPLSFQLLFLPYHIIMKDEGKPIFFYALSLLTIVWFFIWSIADFADANGFVMVGKNFEAKRGAAGVFGLFTALTMLGIAILGVVNVFLFRKR